MPFIEAGGTAVHYVEHGVSADRAARTAVFLHGFTVDHRMMLAAFEPAFATRAGWRRLYLDFPGMGRTLAPATVASTDDVFRVTLAAVEALVPGRFAVAGCSLGGYVALGLAAARHDLLDGVALLVPMVIPRHEQRSLPDPLVLVHEVGLNLGSDTFEDMSVVKTAETRRRTADELDPAVAIADESALERIAARYEGTFPVVPPTGSYSQPTLLMMGRQDSITGYLDQWRLASAWPRATVAVLDRGGHNLQIEQPVLFDALVGEWLDRVEEAAGHS